jgi:glyoxylate utilization-related uncharacterized protein
MKQKNITITIDGKMHKLMNGSKFCFCPNCSLHDFCNNLLVAPCPAHGLGGEYFVELKVEK